MSYQAIAGATAYAHCNSLTRGLNRTTLLHFWKERVLDLNQVRIFVQVVRARSFAEASRRLQIPANSLSRHVRQLESSLDTRLMQRSTRKLTLTPAGASFFDRCAAAVDDVIRAGQFTVGESQTPGGSVRVAAPVDFLDLFKIEWVDEFLRRYPRVKLDFVLDDARADLIGESIDVAFRGGWNPGAQTVYRQLAPTWFQLVASPKYLAAKGVPTTLQDLSLHVCLTGSTRDRAATWNLTGPDGMHSLQVSGNFAANSSRVLLKACVAGLGIALLPSIVTAVDLNAGHLQTVLPQYRRETGEFCALVPSDRQIPGAVAAFVEFAAERLETLINNQVPRPKPRRSRS
jgi:DNA-binding transcriptional LysR family regulator